MRSVALLALAAAAASAADVPKYDSSLNMTIDTGSIDDSTRAGWCTAQSNSCDTLCDKDSSTNDCDYTDLSYDCLCSSNNSAPGLQYYEQTMPTFICKTLFSQCIEQKAGSADGQKACKNNINNLCGSLDPNKAEVGGDDSEETTTGTTATTAAPTSTNTRSSDNSEDVTTTNSDDFAAPTAGPKGIAAMAALGLVAALV